MSDCTGSPYCPITITVQTGLYFAQGDFIRLVCVDDPCEYIVGQVSAYDSGTGQLTLDPTNFKGSGTCCN